MKTENYVRSIRRAISILKCFTPQEAELSCTQIAHKVQFHKATTHRILATLVQDRLIYRNVKTNKYSIGQTLFALGSLYLNTTDVLKAVEPVIKVLNDLTGEAVLASILDRRDVTIVAKEEMKTIFRFAVHIGTVTPAYATAMGKALLSELTTDELDVLFRDERLEPLTQKTITTKAELKRHLKQVRETQVAFNIEEHHEGAVGIGSGIRDVSGKVVAAIGIAIPTFKFSKENSPRLTTLVKMGASLISYQLGYRDRIQSVRDIEEIRAFWEYNPTHLVGQANEVTSHPDVIKT